MSDSIYQEAINTVTRTTQEASERTAQRVAELQQHNVQLTRSLYSTRIDLPSTQSEMAPSLRSDLGQFAWIQHDA